MVLMEYALELAGAIGHPQMSMDVRDHNAPNSLCAHSSPNNPYEKGTESPCEEGTKSSYEEGTETSNEEGAESECHVDAEIKIQSSLANGNTMIMETVPDLEIDMEFDTLDDAYIYYNKYARTIGFSVRKESAKKKNGVVTHRAFVCSKEGFRSKDKRHDQAKYHRDETRTGCLAHMKVRLTSNGKYAVYKFQKAHNHIVETPAKVHLLRSQRKFLEMQEHDASTTSRKSRARKASGNESVGFTVVDCNNYLKSKRQNEMVMFDAGGIFNYFQQRQIQDPYFYYAIQLDEDDQITNIFWTDSRMRVDYEHFGDVICFDTMYRTNKYDRPFAPFIGVNNHKQSIVFGAAFLYDETTESFQWLFRTFCEAMHGKCPRTILTDRGKPIENAIASELPNTIHRLCVWQMFQNAAMHLCTVFCGSSTFKKVFSNCVFDYEEEEEFLQAWRDMINEYDLHENEWLKQLYDDREKWALVYGRETFCADMKSTLRNENMNKYMKKYLDFKQNIVQFFEQFQRLLDENHYAELKANFRMTQSLPSLPFSTKVLEQARRIYTPVIFQIFKEEYFDIYNLMIESCLDFEKVTVYKVRHDSKSRCHTITYNSSDNTITCSCKKFEFLGILCRHVLKVLDVRNIKEIPRKYILKRWTKKASTLCSSSSLRLHTSDDDVERDFSWRFNDLMSKFVKMSSKAAECVEAYVVANKIADDGCQKIEDAFKKMSFDEGDEGDEGIMQNIDDNESLGDCSKVNQTKRKERNVSGGRDRIESCHEKSKSRRQACVSPHANEGTSTSETQTAKHSIPSSNVEPQASSALQGIVAPSYIPSNPCLLQSCHHYPVLDSQGCYACIAPPAPTTNTSSAYIPEFCHTNLDMQVSNYQPRMYQPPLRAQSNPHMAYHMSQLPMRAHHQPIPVIQHNVNCTQPLQESRAADFLRRFDAGGSMQQERQQDVQKSNMRGDKWSSKDIITGLWSPSVMVPFTTKDDPSPMSLVNSWLDSLLLRNDLLIFLKWDLFELFLWWS